MRLSFAIPAKFRRKINLATVTAGLTGGMDNDFLHELPQKRWGQLGGLGVLLDNFQIALDIDCLRLNSVYDSRQILYGLFQCRLLLFVALEQLGKAFLTQLGGTEALLPRLLHDLPGFRVDDAVKIQAVFGIVVKRGCHPHLFRL